MDVPEQTTSKEHIAKDLSSDQVAKYLLQERFLLTALELHAELVEAGLELPRLRDYFSNPANFDLFSKQSSDSATGNAALNRSSSQTTLDSLDWARYSEDGERVVDDRVAVLEFELRKAKETIQGLRANLTQAAAAVEDEECTTEDASRKLSGQDFNVKELKPHQTRTLNFLINEYLSMMGYKMAAITFADENDNQDFENWDDVGLNIPRPSSLPQWIFEKGQNLVLTSCVACQTDEAYAKEEEKKKREYEEQIILLNEKTFQLEALCERQEKELQKLERRMSTPHITPLGTPKKEIANYTEAQLPAQNKTVDERIAFTGDGVSYAKVDLSGGPELDSSVGQNEEITGNDPSVIRNLCNDEICDNQDQHRDNSEITSIGPTHVNIESLEDMLESTSSNHYRNTLIEDPSRSVDSTMDYLYTANSDCNEDSNDVLERDPICERGATVGEEMQSTPSESIVDDVESAMQDDPDVTSETSDILDPRKCDRLPPLGACSDWNPQALLAGEFITAQREEAKSLLRDSSPRQVPEYLEKQLLTACLGCTLGVDSRLQTEVASLSLGHCDLLFLVSSSLHNIAPNVILSKREELLPLLVYCISQNPESSQREKLLHLLFNLTKRPDKEQRSTILLGLVSLARVLQPEKLEAELLPQCWEQLTHKYSERRLLVAQSVAVLAPYTPAPLRNSLLVSMLQQLLSSDGEKDPGVIDAAMASMSLLIAYLDDVEKLSSLFGVLLHCLEATSGTFSPIISSVLPQNTSSVVLLFVSLVQWSLETSSLSQIIQSTLSRLKSLSHECQKERLEGRQSARMEQLSGSMVALIKALNLMCPYLVVMLFNSLEICDDTFEGNTLASSPSAFALIGEISVLLDSRDKAEECVAKVYHCISKLRIHEWPELEFVVEFFITDVIECITLIEADMKEVIKGYVDLVWRINACFGHHSTTEFVSPLFLKQLSVDENAIEKIKGDMTPLTKAPLIVYAVGVLGDEDHKAHAEALSDFLSRQISILALCGAPNTALQMTILLLLEKTRSVETILGALWSCVVHRSSLVRASTALLWGLLVGQVKEADLSSRVIPALVTLATDTEVSVRAASIAPLTAIIANSPSKEVCDKVWLQLETICEETYVVESSTLQLAIAQTCSFFGHNTPSQLLHLMYLPCLCRATLEGRTSLQDKAKFGVALLEAYTALSSSTIPDHLVAHFILPPLNQLQKTLGAMSFEHMETITLLIKEYTLRAQATIPTERIRGSFSSGSLSSFGQSISNSVGVMGAGLPIGSGVEDVKNKMSKMFTSGKAMSSGLQAKAPTINLPALFKKK